MVAVAIPAAGQVSQVLETSADQELPALVTTALDPKRDDNYAVITSEGHVVNTTDGGKEWSEGKIDAISAGSSWLFSDKKGNLYQFGLTEGKFISSTSGDLGVSWKPMGEFEFEDLEGRPNLYFHPDKGDIFMSYVSTRDCVSKVVFQQSRNSKKWSDNQILMDRSFDGGDTWLRTDMKFKDVTGDLRFGLPRLDADRSMGMLRGSLYTVWTLNNDGKSQILAARSANGGDFWTPSVPVSMEDNAKYPLLEIDQSNGIVYVAYWNETEEGVFDVYLAFSIDGAQTFKSIKMNDAAVLSGEDILYRSLSMSVMSNRIIIAWASSEDGIRKYFTRVTSYGEISEAEN